MKILTKISIALTLISAVSTIAATVDFGTTNHIAFRCQVDIFEKKVNPVSYRAYAGRLINSVFHEQYNNIMGPDLKMLMDYGNGRALFSNVIIGGNGYLKWSVVETDDHAFDILDARWPISARVLYSQRHYDRAKNRKSLGESNDHLYRVECFEIKQAPGDDDIVIGV